MKPDNRLDQEEDDDDDREAMTPMQMMRPVEDA